MPIDWRPFCDLVGRSERFLLTSHMRPDCDALGSELGMAAILRTLGKQVRIVNGDAVPAHLKFIDPASRIEQLNPQAPPAADSLDVFLVLDTSAWVQLGPMGEVLRATKAQKVVVDHHVSEDDLGAVQFKDTQAESCGTLVLEAARALGVSLTREMAEPLFAAIATDTGWFRFPSVDGDTFRDAGQTVDAGASPPGLYSALYEQESHARLLLRGRILSGAKTDLGGRLIYAVASADDFAATGALAADTDEVVNHLLRVAGVEAALVFQEMSPDRTKTSFRSKSAVNVREVAEQFGGGGHTMAAGATLSEPLAAAQQKILDAMRKAMR